MTATPQDRQPITLDPGSDTATVLRTLFDGQRLATLGSSDQGQPYVNLVAFAATDDLTGLIFVTPRQTRKYANLRSESRAAMLVDSRSNDVQDFESATAATATGRVVELEADERRAALESYLRKHPELESFATAATSAVFRLDVERYVLVTRFEHVTEIVVER